MNGLRNQVTVVTGGASGIGEATVRRFVAAGARVVVADVQDDRGRALADELGAACSYRHADVSLESDLRQLVADTMARHGRIDCLFNNAGVAGPHDGIAELRQETWDAMLALLLRSVYLGMRFGAACMRQQGHGTIISTAAVAGLQTGWGSHVYSAANAAVIHLTRSVANELAPCGVRVNCICPGDVATPFRSSPAPSARAALPWAGTADDVAAAAVWLASDQARFVTGHALVVDGGQSCGACPTAPSARAIAPSLHLQELP